MTGSEPQDNCPSLVSSLGKLYPSSLNCAGLGLSRLASPGALLQETPSETSLADPLPLLGQAKRLTEPRDVPGARASWAGCRLRTMTSLRPAAVPHGCQPLGTKGQEESHRRAWAGEQEADPLMGGPRCPNLYLPTAAEETGPPNPLGKADPRAGRPCALLLPC